MLVRLMVDGWMDSSSQCSSGYYNGINFHLNAKLNGVLHIM